MGQREELGIIRSPVQGRRRERIFDSDIVSAPTVLYDIRIGLAVLRQPALQVTLHHLIQSRALGPTPTVDTGAVAIVSRSRGRTRSHTRHPCRAP